MTAFPREQPIIAPLDEKRQAEYGATLFHSPGHTPWLSSTGVWGVTCRRRARALARRLLQLLIQQALHKAGGGRSSGGSDLILCVQNHCLTHGLHVVLLDPQRRKVREGEPIHTLSSKSETFSSAKGRALIGWRKPQRATSLHPLYACWL